MHLILRGLRFVESLCATAAYAVVASLLIYDVVGREVFGTSFLGADQLAVYGAILAGFLGLTLATSDNAHLRPGFMDFVFQKHESTAIRIGDVISCIFFIASAIVALSFVEVSMVAKDRAPVFYFVVWPLQIIIPYAFLSCAIKHGIFALRPDLKPNPDGAV
ncbi:MAG: TRAP transporter small permease [Paracoccaceae bacterium]